MDLQTPNAFFGIFQIFPYIFFRIPKGGPIGMPWLCGLWLDRHEIDCLTGALDFGDAALAFCGGIYDRINPGSARISFRSDKLSWNILIGISLFKDSPSRHIQHSLIIWLKEIIHVDQEEESSG